MSGVSTHNDIDVGAVGEDIGVCVFDVVWCGCTAILSHISFHAFKYDVLTLLPILLHLSRSTTSYNSIKLFSLRSYDV